MAKLVELLKSSLIRERQWADTQIDTLRFDELIYDVKPGDLRRDFPATVPMQLSRML